MPDQFLYITGIPCAGGCITHGAFTACFGGVIRNALLNNVPLLFRKEICAMVCIAGGLICFLLKAVKMNAGITAIPCILIIFASRLSAARFKLSLPQFYNSTIKI
jgi:uncharacterized membrane protein YeiH